MTETAENVVPITDEEFDAKLPKPTGYHILIALPKVEETFKGSGIVKATRTVYEEHILSITGIVMAVGPDAYNNPTKFPTGPWCKEGDYVLFRANSGTRFVFDGVEYRMMNDDTIEGVVPDPSLVSRVMA